MIKLHARLNYKYDAKRILQFDSIQYVQMLLTLPSYKENNNYNTIIIHWIESSTAWQAKR